MKDLIIKESNLDAQELESLLESLNFNASTIPSNPQIRLGNLKRYNPYIKCLLAAGTLSVYNLGELIAGDKVLFEDSIPYEISLIDYNDNIDYPCNSYMSELSEFVFLNKTSKMDIVKKIVSFESLKQNWDGYEAIPLEVNSAANSINIINLLDEKIVERIDDIYPNTHGTISFDWTNSSNERLSIEVGNNTFSYYLKLNSQPPLFFNDIEINSTEISKLSQYINTL